MTTDVPLTSLYQDLILDHYRKPRNRGTLPDATVEVHVRNPTCGDEIRLQLLLEDGVIADLRFEGEGCSISQASASMMTSLIRGKPLPDALALGSRFTEMMHADADAATDGSLRDLRALAGVARFPVRVRCALLGFDALREAARQSAGEAP
ncbi:MAG: SUF system NifU family Fe-S cluster assembly protein [Gemmatimonadales bacterium]|nr:MAG: SUF system NifU family Fe-S cluster assembly protein [Gemmatimonadales bacterium]